MIAPLFCGYLGFEFGWHYGFGAAGIGMLAGLIVFWKGIKDGVLGDKGLQPVNYIGKKISGLKIEHIIYFCGFLSVPVFAYIILLNTQSEFLGNAIIAVGVIIFIYLSYIIYDLKINQKDKASGDRLIAVMIFCVFLTVFWACFEIAGSAVTVWADRCVNLFGINASQTNAINPGYIVLLAIPFSWIWTKLDISNKNPSTPIKFSLGILQLGLGFLVFATSFFYMGENGKVPMIFLCLGYLLITTGELFLSPIGLSKVTQLAPKKIISFIMGVWFLSSTFAHHISGQIAKLTTKEFYSETNIITIKDGESQESYVFDMEFDFNNNIKGIKKITEYNNDKNEYSFVEEKELSEEEKEIYKIEKENVNKLIIHNLLNKSRDDFWWDVNNDGLLILTLKSEKEINEISDENTDKVEDIITQLNKKITGCSPVELKPSLITSFYKTNESIKGNQDAIAGVRFLDDNAKIYNTGNLNKNGLAPGLYSVRFATNEGVDFQYKYNIKEGPSDVLSTYAYKFLGSPEIKNKTVATLLQYNTVYMKIGIVTILISLLVMLTSPFLRKLMHGVK
jgi:dipeptide/tripeptide permease